MSKYNLTDILEQYKIGSGWTSDFDYEGMLNAGLRTSLKDDIKVLKQIFEDFTDVNYHREAEHLSYAIDALEDGDAMEAEGKLSDFHAEIKKTMEGFNMDMSDDLGAFMASKMDLDEEEKKLPMDEVRIEKEVASRIEGLMNIKLKKQFLDVFEDLWLDLIEEDPFYAEDVIAHLSNEMSKQISNRQAQGDRLAGMEESDSYVDEIGEGAMQPGEADLEAGVKGNMDALDEEDSIKEALPKFKGVPPMKDIVKALKNDAKATDSEIKQFMASVKKAGDEFDDVDDYVEDFKNYVADKALQEHFGRFMKDYQ
ncbi:hypothetical protein N9923_00130 [bacterium]|nr:hypothetical protein [bacterium]